MRFYSVWLTSSVSVSCGGRSGFCDASERVVWTDASQNRSVPASWVARVTEIAAPGTFQNSAKAVELGVKVLKRLGEWSVIGS